MKYRNMATQVKEIPIIFRGAIEAASGLIWESDALNWDSMSASIDTGDVNTAWFVVADIIPPFTSSEIKITLNDQQYTLTGIKKHFTEEEAFTAGEWFFYNIEVPDDLTELPYIPEIIDDSIPVMLHGVIPDDGGDPSYSFYFLADIDPDTGDFISDNSATIEEEGSPAKKTFSAELTGNGQIKRFHARFACGENGTLHLNPYVILNGNITIKLCDFAKGGDDYIAGDNEEISFDCYVPVETHALACLDVENVGEYPSIVDAAIVVQYEDYIEPESIVGYEGINLHRGK